MERKLGLLLVITVCIAILLGWTIVSEPGRVQRVQAEAAEAMQGGQGAQLYSDNCASCHGKYGEGIGGGTSGPPPLSSRELLTTFDDATLRAVVAKGKASRGMPGFSHQSGGSLDEAQIDHIVAYIRNWQYNPPQIPPKPAAPAAQAAAPAPPAPAALPAASATPTSPAKTQPSPTPVSVTATQAASGGGAPTATTAPAVTKSAPTPTTAATVQATAAPPQSGGVSFAQDVLPVLKASCVACHGAAGNFASTSYSTVMSTGAHKPVVVPGDPDKSVLVQKLKGTQTFGTLMPPGAPLSADKIQKIVDWIKEGAKDN